MAEVGLEGSGHTVVFFAGTSLAPWSFLEPVVRGSEASVHTGVSAAWDPEEDASDVSQLIKYRNRDRLWCC